MHVALEGVDGGGVTCADIDFRIHLNQIAHRMTKKQRQLRISKEAFLRGRQ